MKTTRFNDVSAGSTSVSGMAGGPVGGDLGGGLPAPSVTGLQGYPICATTPVTNDVLTFNGTEWCPAPATGTTLPSGLAGQSLFLESDGSTLKWMNKLFPVEAFGAVHDGTTDDTSAIQSAINACMTAGGGTVFFANGVYAINGALVSTGSYNSQLTIPANAASGSTPPIAIAFVGEGPASQSTNGTSNAYGPSQSGAILLSNWAGTISGHPAVIAGGTYGTTFPSAGFNWVEVTFQNIEIRTQANPKLTAVQMTSVATVNILGAAVSTTAISNTMSLPSNSNAVGWDLPIRVNANPPLMLGWAWADGYYTGFRMSEVAHGVNLQASHCTVGIEFAGAEDHAANIDRVLLVACATGLSFTGGIFYLDIAMLDIEHSIGSGTFQRVYDIADASNYGHGFISYHTVQAGVGADNDLSINGGGNLSLHSPAGNKWTLNSIVAIPTGTDPSSSPSTGGFLYAASATGHPTWKDTGGTAHDLLTSSSPLTTKGDLYGHSTVDARIPVGTDGQVLTADSAQTLGLKWADPTGGTASWQHAHVQNVVFSGDGATTSWVLPSAPVDAYSIVVFVGGSRSQDWTLSGGLLDTLTFGSAPASGTNNIAVDIVAALS